MHKSENQKKDRTSPNVAGWRVALPALATGMALVLVVGFYALLQVRSFTPAYAEGDPDGYIWIAKQLARGRPIAVPDSDPFLFQTHVWVENERGDVLPKFAPGYPVLMALAYRIGGDRALFAVSPIMGGLAILGLYYLARLWGCGRFSAVLAATIPALSHMYHFYAGYLLTHATDVAVVVWGFVFLWRWMRFPTAWRWALAAGLALGLSALVRHTNAVLALSVALAAGGTVVESWVRRRDGRPLGPAAVLLAAYAVGPVLLGLYHLEWFGRFFASGYRLSSEQEAFGWRYFWLHAHRLNEGLSHDLLYLLFPIGLLGILTLDGWKERLIRLGWIVPIYLTYATYYFSTDGQASYRFLLTAMPLFVAAAFAFLERVPLHRAQRATPMVVLVLLFGLDSFTGLRSAWRGEMYASFRQVAQAGELLDAAAESDAVVFLSPQVKHAVGTRRTYRSYALDAFTKPYGQRAFQPWRYHPWRSEVIQQESRRARFEDFYRTHSDEALQAMKKDLVARWTAAGRQVVFVLPGHEPRREAQELAPEFELRAIAASEGDGQKTWGIYQAVRPDPDASPDPARRGPDRGNTGS